MKIILFGAPGSGKGTQTPDLCNFLNAEKISLGDILREEVKKDSVLGKEVKGYMDRGILVPDELVSRVVEEAVNNKEFVLDGYPRNLNQAKRLEEILKKKKQDIDAFIYLEIDELTIINRLSERRICKQCSALYHLKNMPSKKRGICDVCGGELYQRPDDKPEVIRKRWEVFLKENQNLLDFYQKKGKLIKIDARGEKEIVFERIKDKLKLYSTSFNAR